MAEILNSKAAFKAGSGLSWRSLLLCQAFAIGLSPLLPLSAMAQVATPSATPGTTITPGNTTILPTDVVPLADRDAYKTPIGELLQLKIMQRLPARLYFSSSIEVTGRNETNPFQFPLKRRLMADLPRPAIWRLLSATQQASLYDIIGQVARNNMVFRALPNVSGGWTLGAHTRLFTNYFMIRDQLNHSMKLNTVIHSYAVGLQHDIPLGAKGSMQLEFQGRELWQLHQQSVFDFLPGITLSYIATPRTVLFVNALIQARGKAPFQAPTKELDPFFTWGGLYQKNGWTFSASSTFVQNFREPFHSFATIPKNSYVIISDFEIARRVIKQYPGLQAFCRAEPIWNFHASNIPSLSGMDFRMFFGMRFAMAKPALTSTLQQIREQLKQEGEEGNPQAPGKPSAEAPVIEQPIAQNPQPIHGFLEAETFSETCKLPAGEQVLIAEDTNSADSQAAAATPEAAKNLSDSIAQTEDGESSPATTSMGSSGRSLDAIAAASNVAAPPALASPTENKIMDLSTAQIDWKDLESTPLASSTNQEELHSLLGQAEEQSNSQALQGRGQKLQEIAAKQEKEYKLAFAPPPVSIKPAVAAVPTLLVAKPVTKPVAIKEQDMKALVAVPQSLLPANRKVASAIARATSTPEATGLAHHSNAPSQPSSHPELAFVPAVQSPVQAPEMEASQSILQPMQRQSGNTINTMVPLADMRSSKKLAVAPVPVSSKTAVTPNAIPSPVTAKMLEPAGVLPSVRGKALVQDQSTSTDKTPAVQHIANKDGSIPVTEAKLDKFQGKILSQTKPEAIAPAVSANTGASGNPTVATNSTASRSANSNSATKQSTKADAIIASASIPQTGISAAFPLNKTRVGVEPKAAIPSAQQLRMEENANAVSLLETEICSPKIAMAVYENWQSPVLDDPLIGIEDGPKNMGAKSVKPGLEPGIMEDAESIQKQKQADKKRTDMRLIPPFPSSDQARNSQLKDLPIPVLPVH